MDTISQRLILIETKLPQFEDCRLVILLCRLRCGDIKSGREPPGNGAGITRNDARGILEIFQCLFRISMHELRHRGYREAFPAVVDLADVTI